MEALRAATGLGRGLRAERKKEVGAGGPAGPDGPGGPMLLQPWECHPERCPEKGKKKEKIWGLISKCAES